MKSLIIFLILFLSFNLVLGDIVSINSGGSNSEAVTNNYVEGFFFGKISSLPSQSGVGANGIGSYDLSLLCNYSNYFINNQLTNYNDINISSQEFKDFKFNASQKFGLDMNTTDFKILLNKCSVSFPEKITNLIKENPSIILIFPFIILFILLVIILIIKRKAIIVLIEKRKKSVKKDS